MPRDAASKKAERANEACVRTDSEKVVSYFSSHMKRVDIVATASKVSSQDQKT